MGTVISKSDYTQLYCSTGYGIENIFFHCVPKNSVYGPVLHKTYAAGLSFVLHETYAEICFKKKEERKGAGREEGEGEGKLISDGLWVSKLLLKVI